MTLSETEHNIVIYYRNQPLTNTTQKRFYIDKYGENSIVKQHHAGELYVKGAVICFHNGMNQL
jgi:hypothetical protein